MGIADGTFVQALSDSELLSILIGSGTTQHNAVEIGSMILSNFDRDLAKLSKADFRELKEVEGVGTYTACKILAAIELGRRRQSAMMGLSPDLCSATAIYNYMRPKMQDLKVEEAHVILMNHWMRIHFLDHVIVCDGQYYSYAENGRL